MGIRVNRGWIGEDVIITLRRFEGRRVKIALYDVSLVMGGGAVMPDVETVGWGSIGVESWLNVDLDGCA